MEGWEGVKEGVRGREDGGAVGSHGDGKVSELPCLLRGRSRKTTEFSAAAAVVVVVQFLFWPPEDGATKADGRVSGGEVPGSPRDKDIYTHTGGLCQYYINQPRPKRLLTAAVWRSESAP